MSGAGIGGKRESQGEREDPASRCREGYARYRREGLALESSAKEEPKETTARWTSWEPTPPGHEQRPTQPQNCPGSCTSESGGRMREKHIKHCIRHFPLALGVKDPEMGYEPFLCTIPT